MPQKSQKFVRRALAVENLKKEIKSELDARFDSLSIERLDYILSQVSTCEKSDSDYDKIRYFIYSISALYHHARVGGLSSVSANRIQESAFMVLNLLGIPAIDSKLSYLHGEINLAASLLARQEGRHWDAAWYQKLAELYSGQNKVGGTAFSNLSEAIRDLRLGWVYASIAKYHEALSSESLAQRSRIQAGLGLAKAQRLHCNWEEARETLKDLKARFDLNELQTLELHWELACIDSTQDRSAHDLIRMTKPGASHFMGVYVLEAYLWTRAFGRKSEIDRLRSIAYLHKKKDLGFKNHTNLFATVKLFENLQEQYSEIAVKTRQCFEILRLSSLVPTLEQELLTLLCLKSAMNRGPLNTLQDLVVQKYKTRVIGADGIIPDPLNSTRGKPKQPEPTTGNS